MTNDCPVDTLENYTEEYQQKCLDRLMADIERADSEQEEWDMRNNQRQI